MSWLGNDFMMPWYEIQVGLSLLIWGTWYSYLLYSLATTPRRTYSLMDMCNPIEDSDAAPTPMHPMMAVASSLIEIFVTFIASLPFYHPSRFDYTPPLYSTIPILFIGFNALIIYLARKNAR